MVIVPLDLKQPVSVVVTSEPTWQPPLYEAWFSLVAYVTLISVAPALVADLIEPSMTKPSLETPITESPSAKAGTVSPRMSVALIVIVAYDLELPPPS